MSDQKNRPDDEGRGLSNVEVESKVLQSYDALRSYNGWATGVTITQKNVFGFFEADPTDIVSQDNGATVIVSASDMRYKRCYNGAVQLSWFIESAATDHTAAWAAAITLNNMSGSKGILLELPDEILKVTSELPAITNPIWICGRGTSHSIVYFAGVNGFVMDHSAQPAGSSCGKITDISITTDSTTKTGLTLIGKSTDAPGVKFNLERVDFCPHGRVIGSEDATEWAIAITVGKSKSKTNEVNFSDVSIFGSAANDLYATRTASVGVMVYGSTGFRYDRPKIARVGRAIVITGQSEGTLITGGTILGVDKGIVFTGLVPPANNHVVDGTHISAYTRGVAFEQPVSGAALSLGNFVNGTLVLEREDAANKSECYVAIEFYCKYSAIRDALVWSNAFSGKHERVGIRTCPHNNKINVTTKNSHFALDILPYDADPDGGCVYAGEIIATGANFLKVDRSGSSNLVYTKFVSPHVGAAGINQRATSSRLISNLSDKNLFRINSNGIVIGENATASVAIDISSTPSGTSAYDTRLLSMGGDADGGDVGKGDLQISAATVRFDCSAIRPEIAGQTSVGLPDYPFNALFSNTGTIQASDERLKQLIRKVDDNVLDAWSKVEYQMYKFNQSVEDKGESARWHFGVIAQRVEEAFRESGLDAFEFGILGHDQWDERPEVRRTWPEELADDGTVLAQGGSEVITAHTPAGDRYSVRYDEANNLELALMRRTLKRQMDIVLELQEKLSRS